MLRTAVAISRYGNCKKAHIPVVESVLKKPHVSDCCYEKDGYFNPTYHDWLVAAETKIETDRQTDRQSAGRE